MLISKLIIHIVVAKMCKECECSTCMNDKQCTWFFAGWNIATSFICMILASVRIHKYYYWTPNEARMHSRDLLFLSNRNASCKLAISSVVLAASIVHLLSGCLLMIGLSKDIRWVFVVGKTMSHIFPCVMLLTIFFPVVHCVCMIRVCKFHRSHW